MHSNNKSPDKDLHPNGKPNTTADTRSAQSLTPAADPRADNSTRHGLFAWLASARVPKKVKGSAHVRRQLNGFKVALLCELERLRARQTVLSEALAIQTAVRHEGRAILLTRMLVEEWEKLTVGDRAGLLREISNASDSRDKVLRQLGLDQAARPIDPWQAIYSRGLTPPGDRPAGATPEGPAPG